MRAEGAVTGGYGLRWLAGACGALYAVGYLYLLGDLGTAARPAWGWQWAADPWRWLEARGAFHYDAVARLDAGPLVLLVSPLDLLIAGLLATLVAANLHGAVSLARGGPACRASAGGALAALPALLAGSACCAPGLLLLLGVPSLGAFAALFGWLVPLSILLLAVTRIGQRQLGAPRWFSA